MAKADEPITVPVFNFHGSSRFDMSVPPTSPWYDLFAMAKRVELLPRMDSHVAAYHAHRARQPGA